MDEAEEMNPYRMHRFNIADLALDHRTVRPGNEEEIERLVHSINSGDKIGPIYAPIVWSQGNRILDGYDRIEASLRCGRKQIWCRLLDCDNLEAEAIAIDANLVRKQLSTAEQDELLWRRKQIHLIRWPQTGHGHNPWRPRGGGRQDQAAEKRNTNDFSSPEAAGRDAEPIPLLEGAGEKAFTHWMAEKLDTSDASVQKGVQRGQLIAPEDRAILDAAGIKTSCLHDLTRAVVDSLPAPPAEILALPKEEQPVAAARWRAEQGRARAHEAALLVKAAGRRGGGVFKEWVERHMPPRETRAEQRARSAAAPPATRRSKRRRAARLPSATPSDASRQAALYGYAPRDDGKGGVANASGSTARDRAPTHRIPCHPRAAAKELAEYFRYDNEMEQLVEHLLREWGAGPMEIAAMLSRYLGPERTVELAKLLTAGPDPGSNGHHQGPVQPAENRR